MQLYVIRHGHKANKLPDYNGGFNTPLSDTGHEQAEHLAAFLEDEGIDIIYSSCQLRSLQTADPAYAALDCEWHVWPVFYEGTRRTWNERYENDPDEATWATAWRAGEPLETPTQEELEEMHGHYYLLSDIPELFPGTQLSQPFSWPEAWWELKRGNTPPLGYARADLGTRALLNRHEEGDSIAIICHGTIGDMLVTSLKDFPRRQRHFSCNNTGVHCLSRRRPDFWRIRYINNTSHLPPELQI